MAELFISALISHFVADWFFQNEWMVINKVSLKHPASYVHAGIHFLAMLVVFAWPYALLIAVTHLFIDTRVPLSLWRRFYRQTNDPANTAFVPFAMWQDQIAHIVVIYAVIMVMKYCHVL